jgi:hypothetical protein
MDLAFWIFVGAALLGASMFTLRVLTNANPPRALAYLHGLVVLCGVGTLVYAAFTGPHSVRALMALLVLGLAGTAGAYLAFVDHKHELVPVDQVAVHAGIALAGLTTLGALALAST